MIRRKFLAQLGLLQAQADFDPHRHEYAGLYGVTSTIRKAAEAGLLDWTPPPRKVFKPIHLQRGHAVHKAAELHDKGKLNESTVDTRIRGYVDAWEAFAQVWGYDWDAIETPLACVKLGYAGTPDRVRLGDSGRFRGRLIVLDAKTGKAPRPPRGWEIQTMAYALMWGETAARESIRLAVMLSPDGRFRVEERSGRDAAKDLLDWKKCLRYRISG